MHCKQFEHRLNQVLDQRRDPTQDRVLCVHAEMCPACRSLLGAHQRILSAMRHRKAIGDVPVAVGLIPGDLSRKRPRYRAIAWAGLLATACVVPLLISSWLAATRSVQPQAKLPDVPPPLAAVTPDPTPAPFQPRIVESDPAAVTKEAFGIPWSDLRELNLEWLLRDLEMPPQNGTDWLSRVRQVGGSLRPLTNSATSTFSILRRTWPGTQVTEPTKADQAFLPSDSDLLA